MTSGEMLSSVAVSIATVVTGLFTFLATRGESRVKHRAEQAQSELSQTEAAAREWRTLYDELKSDIADLRQRVEQAEARERQVLIDLFGVWQWIDGGAKPPPPSRPPYLYQWKREGVGE